MPSIIKPNSTIRNAKPRTDKPRNPLLTTDHLATEQLFFNSPKTKKPIISTLSTRPRPFPIPKAGAACGGTAFLDVTDDAPHSPTSLQPDANTSAPRNPPRPRHQPSRTLLPSPKHPFRESHRHPR